MWLTYIFLLIVIKAIAGDVYEIRLFTSDIPFAGTNASVGVQIAGWTRRSRWMYLHGTIDRRNSVTSTHVFDNVDVDYPPKMIRTYIAWRDKIPNAWHAYQIAIRKSGMPHWIVYPIHTWLGERGTLGTIWDWTQSHNETYVEGVTWEVRVFITDLDGAGTHDDVKLSIFGETFHSRWLVMDREKKRNSMIKYYFDTIDFGGATGITVQTFPSTSWHCAKIAIKEIRADQWINYIYNQWLGNNSSRPNFTTKLTEYATVVSETPCMNNCSNLPRYRRYTVCGSDGVDYENSCMLNFTACQSSADVVVAQDTGCTLQNVKSSFGKLKPEASLMSAGLALSAGFLHVTL